MKKLISFLLVSCFAVSLFTGCGMKQKSKTEQEIINTVEEFYEISYDSYLNLEIGKIDSVLDTDSLWGKNYLIVLEEVILSNQYIKEKNYDTLPSYKSPPLISFEEMKVDQDKATVTITLKGKDTKAYPFFVCLGTNKIMLQKKEDKWKITSISAEDTLIKMLGTNEFKKIDPSALYERIDEEYGMKK